MLFPHLPDILLEKKVQTDLALSFIEDSFLRELELQDRKLNFLYFCWNLFIFIRIFYSFDNRSLQFSTEQFLDIKFNSLFFLHSFV